MPLATHTSLIRPSILALFCALGLQAGSAHAALESVKLGNGNYPFSIHSNYSLNGNLNAITRVIVIQHGIGRNGDELFASINALLNSQGSPNTTLVLVPQFYSKTDSEQGKVPNKTPYWLASQWPQGRDSLKASGVRISSFQVIDDILELLKNKSKFPNLKTVVVAGHSAGGQMVQRYGAFSNQTMSSGITLKYVVANAGTYMYFDKARPKTGQDVSEGAKSFAAFPQERIEQIPDFNTYKYGLDGIDDLSSTGFSYDHSMYRYDMFKRYLNRDVTYLLGSSDRSTNGRCTTDDSIPDEGMFDICPAAKISGPHRYARGMTNIAYEKHVAARFFWSRNRTERIVLGIGHDDDGMWSSKCGMQALFGMSENSVRGGASCQVIP